jgi:hypothetical protein
MTAFMHVPLPQTDDLSERRRRVGASRETMAAGVGLTVDDVRAIENGTAPSVLRAGYTTWLERVERWPDDRRQKQFFAAGNGLRFDLS